MTPFPWGAVLLLALAGCFTARPAAVPPPPLQTTANCVAPTYAADALVCADPTLRSLDRQLAALWAEADADPRTTDADRDGQKAWFRQRSLCAFERDQATCLYAAYRARIDAIRRSPAR